MTTRPVWAEISRPRLLENYRLLCRLAGDADLLAIIKADAYGHGAPVCAQAIAAESPRAWLGVTSVEEGTAIRVVAPQARIVVMGSVWQNDAGAAIENGLTPVVWESFQIEALQSAASARGLGSASIQVHIEIDTGMSRQGVRLECLPALLERLTAAPTLRVEGVLTHLHSPEALDNSANSDQLDRFAWGRDRRRRDHDQRLGGCGSAGAQDRARHRLRHLRHGIRRRELRRAQHHRQAVAGHRPGRGPQGRTQAGCRAIRA